MPRKAKLIAAGALVLVFVAVGVVWFRTNSMTAKEAAIYNINRVDDAMRQASSNSPPAATNQAVVRP